MCSSMCSFCCSCCCYFVVDQKKKRKTFAHLHSVSYRFVCCIHICTDFDYCEWQQLPCVYLNSYTLYVYISLPKLQRIAHFYKDFYIVWNGNAPHPHRIASASAKFLVGGTTENKNYTQFLEIVRSTDLL